MLYIISHIFQIIAFFLAFLSGAIAIRLIYVTRGGLASQAISYIAKGTILILVSFFILFIGINADKINPFEPSWFLLISNILLSIGFGFICLGSWILFKELS